MNGMLKGIGLLMLSGVMAWMVSEYRIEVRRLRRKLMRGRRVQSSMYYRF